MLKPGFDLRFVLARAMLLGAGALGPDVAVHMGIALGDSILVGRAILFLAAWSAVAIEETSLAAAIGLSFLGAVAGTGAVFLSIGELELFPIAVVFYAASLTVGAIAGALGATVVRALASKRARFALGSGIPLALLVIAFGPWPFPETATDVHYDEATLRCEGGRATTLRLRGALLHSAFRHPSFVSVHAERVMSGAQASLSVKETSGWFRAAKSDSFDTTIPVDWAPPLPSAGVRVNMFGTRIPPFVHFRQVGCPSPNPPLG
jgi:hypothetical protein